MDYENDRPVFGKGFIYILSNPSMPSIYKVGLTRNSVQQRMQELNTTGVPRPFELVKKYEVHETKLLEIEQLAHSKLTSKNIHHGKEFFEGRIELIYEAVEDAIYEVTGNPSVDLVGQARERGEAVARAFEEQQRKKLLEQQELETERHTWLKKENDAIVEKRSRHAENAKSRITKEINQNTLLKNNFKLLFIILTLVVDVIVIANAKNQVLGNFIMSTFVTLGVGCSAWYVFFSHGWHEMPSDKWFEAEAARLYPFKAYSDAVTAIPSRQR